MFKKKNVFVNEQKRKANAVVVALTMLAIGISWTVTYYEGQTFHDEYIKSYSRAMIIIESRGDAVQDIKTDVTREGTATQASLDGKEEEQTPSPTVEEVEMSAYTSRVEETDSSPCISADGTNICEYDGCVVAYNAAPLGTKVEVEGFGLCEVRDRMNSRYGKNNMDIYFGMDLEGALEFGRRTVEIKVLS